MEELSPEAKSLYEMLTAETREEYESRFMAHKKKILDVVRVSVTDAEKQYKDVHTNLNSRTRGTSTTRSAATSVCTATSARASIGEIPEPVVATATPGTDLHSVTPSNCSTVCLGGDASSTATPASPTMVSIILPFPVEIEDVHDAAHNDSTDIAAPTLTTCSTDWPSRSVVSPVSALISSADSTTTTVPAASETHETRDLRPVTPPAYSTLGLNDISSEEDPVELTHTQVSAPTSLVPLQVIEAVAPYRCMVKGPVECTDGLMPFSSSLGFHFTTNGPDGIHSHRTLLPWPCFKCNQIWTLLVRQVISEHSKRFPFLDALHVLVMLSQQLQVPFIYHVRQKHAMISWGLQRLRPPWPPPELEITDCHIREVARGWTHKIEIVGSIVLHPLGKLVSSPSSMTNNDTSSPCGEWCLDVVLWKISRWCSYTQCVRPANAIRDVSSWPWVTSKHAEVQFQFSNPLIPVNCDLPKVHFLLSGTAQMNVVSHCEGSLNLVGYCGHPSVNIAHTQSWMLIIVGHLFQYGLQADALLLLISWLPMPCLQFCIIRGCPSWTSSSGFLAVLNGEAAGQQNYTCTRIITGWNYHHILRGNTHYSELMHWTFSHSLLLSEFRFCTTGHIIFFCCALEQWEIPWTISLVPPKFWFQCGYAGRESLYSGENFQWTIAWSLSYHFAMSSLQTQSYCAILLVQQNCPNMYRGIWFRFMIVELSGAAILLMTFSDNHCTADVELSLLICAKSHSSDCSQWEIAWLLVWPFASESDFICSGLVTITFWLVFKLGVLPPLRCQDLSFWRYPRVDHMMPNSGFIIQCDFEITQWNIAWPFYWEYFDVGDQSGQLISTATLGYMYTCGISMQSITVLLPRSSLPSSRLVSYMSWSWEHILDPYTTLSWDQFVTEAHTPSKALQLPWDPGDCFACAWPQYSFSRADDGCPCYHIDTSQVPWDPGGLSGVRLEGKLNFKGGGLSTTRLQEMSDGPPAWAVACWKARCEGDRGNYIPRERPEGDWLGRNGLDGGFGRGLAGRERGVCACSSSSFLLDLHPSSPMFL